MSQKFVELIERLGDQQKQYHEINKGNTDELFDRVESLESKGATRGGHTLSAEQREERQEFSAFVRGKTQAKEFQISHKAVSIGSDAAGGHAVAEDLSRRVLRILKDQSPIRQICRVETTDRLSDFHVLVAGREGASGWSAEGGTRSETATPVFSKVSPTSGELYSVHKASNWSLTDMFFDVEAWLLQDIAIEHARQENVAFISGDGSSKPTGFVTTSTPVTTGDDDSPARAFGVLQYVASGAAGAFVNDRLGSPPGNPADVLLDLMHTLRSGYRTGAVWVMSSATLSVVQKFKDGDGNYLLRQPNAAGMPSSLFGHNVIVADDMAVIAANSFSIAFGNFDRGYIVADDAAGLQIIRDPYTSKGDTLFYVSRRIGGDVTDDHSIKLLKFAAS